MFSFDLSTGESMCWVQGECKGIVDFFEEQATANDCLQLCNSTLGCRWFTFYSPSSSSTASSASSSTITTPMPAGNL